MPNWVENNVTFKGDTKDIKKIKELLQGADENGKTLPFDFDKLIPMPNSYDYASGSETEKAYKAFIEEQSLQFMESPTLLSKLLEKSKNELLADIENLETKFLLGKKVVLNLLTFGAKDWYDWCCFNWGTKWNASYQEGRLSDNGEKLFYSFSTAWDIPRGIIDKIIAIIEKESLDVSIDWLYANEDVYGCVGEIEYNPEYGRVDFDPESNKKRLEIYADLWYGGNAEETGMYIDEKGEIVYSEDC